MNTAFSSARGYEEHPPPRHRSASRRAAVPYLALAVAVAGPLLAPGYVLLPDLTQTPDPGIPSAYWGLGQGTHEASPARLPLDALFAALGHIDAVQVGQKLMLL